MGNRDSEKRSALRSEARLLVRGVKNGLLVGSASFLVGMLAIWALSGSLGFAIVFGLVLGFILGVVAFEKTTDIDFEGHR